MSHLEGVSSKESTSQQPSGLDSNRSQLRPTLDDVSHCIDIRTWCALIISADDVAGPADKTHTDTEPHYTSLSIVPSVLWRCWLGGRKGIRPVKTEWWGAGTVICLEQGADLHMVQLMPLPLTVSCFSKIQIGFTFLVLAHPGSLGQRAVKRVCVCLLNSDLTSSKFQVCQLLLKTLQTVLPRNTEITYKSVTVTESIILCPPTGRLTAHHKTIRLFPRADKQTGTESNARLFLETSLSSCSWWWRHSYRKAPKRMNGWSWRKNLWSSGLTYSHLMRRRDYYLFIIYFTTVAMLRPRLGDFRVLLLFRKCHSRCRFQPYECVIIHFVE